MNMNDWKIGTRIAMGYAAVILVTIALAVYAHTQVVVINSSVERITKDSLPGIVSITDIKIGSMHRLATLQEYLATADAGEMARLEALGLRLQTAISGFIVAYEKTIHKEKDRQLFATVLAARAPFEESIRETIQNSRELRNKARAHEMYQMKVKPLYTSMPKLWTLKLSGCPSG